jgi:hypothetical protein
MVNIVIQEPILIELEIMEFDEHLPSIKINCVVKDNSLKGHYTISFNFWVLCNDFDSFGKKQISSLNDLSGVTRFSFEDEKLLIVPSFKNMKVNFDSKISIEISEELKDIMTTKFIEFEKFW